MTIIRVKKDQGYFMASNEPFNDDKLSWEARGVMGYLMSKPDGWEIRFEDLVRKGPAGRSKIERILDELMEAGYVNRIQGRRPDGTYYYESVVYESSLLNPTYNDQKLKERLRKKREAQARRRRAAYEKKLKQSTLSESPPGLQSTLSESVSGESVSGESPPLVNTKPANTDSVNTNKNPTTTRAETAAEKLTDFYLTYISTGKVSQTAVNLINCLLETYSGDDINYAIDQAVKNSTAENNKCTLAYVEAVCERRQSGQPDQKPKRSKNNGHSRTIPPAQQPAQATGLGEFIGDFDNLA